MINQISVKPKKISSAVLITCHNRKEKTVKCLDLLFKQKNEREFLIDVFLVDDGSTDGTSDAIKIQFPKVHIIKGDGNLFWNRGMNLAWKEASKMNPDYYLWLNDDTFLFENGINSLLKSSFEKENQAIIVGSTISEISKIITYGGRYDNGQIIEPNDSLQDCFHFNGNLVLIPKKVFEKVGFLDPIFHHAVGDFDYGMRARKKGVQLFISPEFNGFCEGHENFSKWCRVETPLIQRLKTLYSSTCECNPKQFFIFEKRHYGLIQAMKHLITIHIRAFLPKLWYSLKVKLV